MFSGNDKKEIFSTQESILRAGSYLKALFPGDTGLKKEYEQYSFLIFMYFIVQEGIWDIPFEVIHDDAPDFRVFFPERSLGFEVTIATTKSYKHASSVAEREYPEGSLIEMSEYWESGTSKDSVRKGIRFPREALQGCGWGDNGQENFWVDCMVNSIQKKYSF